MACKLNQLLEDVNVREDVFERTPRNSSTGEEYQYRVYYCTLDAKGQPPIFLFTEPHIHLKLGKQDVYVEKDSLPVVEASDRNAKAFTTDYQLKRLYNRIYGSDDKDWGVFFDTLRTYEFYKVSTPISELNLKELTEEEVEHAVEQHVCGGFEVDDRIRAWGYGGLVRLPQNRRYAKWTKYRGHSLIIKGTKSGCTSIAKRTSNDYDQVSLKSFEGFSDAEGEISYSPLHENFHSANFDEFHQFTDGVMGKLYTFMETGEYLTVKASRNIKNRGGCRISFTTNPPAMNNSKGGVYAVDEFLDAFLLSLNKLTDGNFEGGMSRFGMVLTSKTIKAASGREVFDEEQEYSNAIATSLFETLTPKLVGIYRDEQISAWLSTPLAEYSAEILRRTSGFDDDRLRKAWEGQRNAYRHVKGAALEIAIAENAYRLLHDELTVAGLVEEAEVALQDVIAWNLLSLDEIMNAAAKEETVEILVKRMNLAKPAYIRPLIVAYILSETGDLKDMEMAYDTLPRQIRDVCGGEQYYCWSHIERRVKEGGGKRAARGLKPFGIICLGGKKFGADTPAQLARLQQAATKVLEQIKGGLTCSKDGGSAIPEKDCPNCPSCPTPTGKPENPIAPDCPEGLGARAIQGNSKTENLRHCRAIGADRAVFLPPATSPTTSPNDVVIPTAIPTVKRVVFKPKENLGERGFSEEEVVPDA